MHVCVFILIITTFFCYLQPSYSNTDRYRPDSTINKIKDTLDFICNQCFVVSTMSYKTFERENFHNVFVISLNHETLTTKSVSFVKDPYYTG